MTIRALEFRDVEAILAIQAACPEIAQWTAWDYDRVARGEMAGWVAEEGSQGAVESDVEVSVEVAGFLVARRVSSDLEILNFAVESDWRRCGIGAALLSEALKWATDVSGDARHTGSARIKPRRAAFLHAPQI